jgi:hypothetical protein
VEGYSLKPTRSIAKMPLKGYESSFRVERSVAPAIKLSDLDWKRLLQKKAEQALSIDPNVNLDPDFITNTSLHQIQYEYDKRIGKTPASVGNSVCIAGSVEPLSSAPSNPAEVRKPMLRGKANYDLLLTSTRR